MSVVRDIRGGRRGAVVLLAMIFIAVFAALALALATVSGSNLQVASNQCRVNAALHAAQSGLECARYLVQTVTLPLTNLGNTNPQQSDNNVLTGAIVGGIVDVRGNAQVFGTIISMADTSMYPSGYVTNIGATLGDGGSETTEVGDIGVIAVTPKPDALLPSGIISPIIIKPDTKTYCEGV